MNIVHCKKGHFDEYVGRPKAGGEWRFGNPFVIGRDGDRPTVIDKMDKWLEMGQTFNCPDATEKRRLWILENIEELRGKTLGCWCDYPKEDCHGRIYLQRLEKTKNWFSNMLPLDEPFIYDGITFLTSENFYQAMKMPKDRKDLRAEIAALGPFKAKTAIRDKTKYPWREDWNQEMGLKVMWYILGIKFAKGTSWAAKLLGTEGKIVEWSTWGDSFWGWDVKKKTGENNLGKILMDIREGLK